MEATLLTTILFRAMVNVLWNSTGKFFVLLSPNSTMVLYRYPEYIKFLLKHGDINISKQISGKRGKRWTLKFSMDQQENKEGSSHNMKLWLRAKIQHGTLITLDQVCLPTHTERILTKIFSKISNPQPLTDHYLS